MEAVDVDRRSRLVWVEVFFREAMARALCLAEGWMRF